ncbi:MAG TPA: ATP-binding protein [Blastocatellia bacterium]
MKTSHRLILILTVVAGIVMIVGGYFMLRQREKALELAMRNEVRAHAVTLQIALERLYLMGNPAAAQDLIDRMSDNQRIYGVVLFSNDGRVLMASDELMDDEIKFPPEVNQALATDDAVEIIRTIDGKEVFSILAPVRVGAAREGVVEIALPMAFIKEDYARARREIVIFALLLFIAIVFVVILVTRYSVLRPVDELLRGARALGRGDLNYRLIVPANDNEFALLEREFNRMADNLEEQRNNAVREMEQRLKLERQLRHTEHLASVGRLAAGVAHEVGTPLNVIEVRAEQILQDLDDSRERRRRNATIILTQVERISNIVRQLLNLARPYNIQRGTVDLNALISSTLETLETRLQPARIVVEFEPDREAFVSGDRELLRQVFINVIVNAIQAMPDGGRLRIDYGSEPTEKDGALFIATRVSDTGVGIEEENFPFLFDPFYTTKDVGVGVGLGLPVSRRIVEEHGGWIEAANNEDGGATFTVYLQLAEKAIAAQAIPAENESLKRY